MGSMAGALETATMRRCSRCGSVPGEWKMAFEDKWKMLQFVYSVNHEPGVGSNSELSCT